mmetsp:Transcript_11769/g.32076  ORF Transcript_11769/g.32076 Transcript_11769/m.32076 type:complete len:230 (+) Transcript_11769:119-808(+)
MQHLDTSKLKPQDSLDDPLDLEHQPLVPPSKGGMQAFNEKHTGMNSMHQDDGLEYKTWRSPWYCCLGECSLMDWLACCTVANVPCLAFGWNQMRAFQMTWWKECAKYIAATMVITTMIHVANSLITPNIKTSDAPGGGRQAQMPSDDQKLAGVILILVASVGGLLFALWMASRRGMLRSRFNIKGTQCSDRCLWLCCPSCALCQETRTLMHNRVEEGVWHGPPRMAEMP